MPSESSVARWLATGTAGVPEAHRTTSPRRQIATVYLLSGIVVLSLWLLDSAIDYLTFNPQARSFWDIALLDILPHEIYIRTLIACVCLGTGVLVARFVSHRAELEETLIEESQSIRKLMEVSPVGIAILGAEGEIIYANTRAESLLGISKTAITQRSYDAVAWRITDLQGGPFPTDRLPFQRVRATGQPVYDVQHAIEWPDGRRVLLNINAVPLTDATDRFEGLVASFEDITNRVTAETALIESEQRYRSVYDTAPLAFVVWDLETRVTDWNRRAEELFGWRRDEILGQSFFEFLIPESAQQLVEEVVASLPDGHLTPHAINENIAKDGRLLLCEWNNAVLHDSAGKIVGAISLGLDITRRREAERALRASEERFRTLFDTMQEGVAIHEMVYDDAGKPVDYRIVNVNASFEAVTSIRAEDAIGVLATELYGADEAPFLDLYAEVASSGRPALFETPYEPLNKHFSISVASPGPGQFATIFSDITDRVRNERELRAHRRHLEELVAERTAQLEARTKELEDFSYSVSHDLKAPLRGIDGYSHLLLRDYGDQLDAEGITFLTNVREAASRMHQLIDDLLAYSRLERREVVESEIDVAALVALYIRALDPEIQSRNIRITVDLPFATVRGDAESFDQCLRNLLENAVKFTSTTPDPKITIGGEDHDDAYIIYVRDNGIGFDMRYHDKIFQIFQRLHRSTDYPGTGVGLAIVRKAMERIGGRAWAESAPGKGATFYLSIPKTESSQS